MTSGPFANWVIRVGLEPNPTEKSKSDDDDDDDDYEDDDDDNDDDDDDDGDDDDDDDDNSDNNDENDEHKDNKTKRDGSKRNKKAKQNQGKEKRSISQNLKKEHNKQSESKRASIEAENKKLTRKSGNVTSKNPALSYQAIIRYNAQSDSQVLCTVDCIRTLMQQKSYRYITLNAAPLTAIESDLHGPVSTSKKLPILKCLVL